MSMLKKNLDVKKEQTKKAVMDRLRDFVNKNQVVYEEPKVIKKTKREIVLNFFISHKMFFIRLFILTFVFMVGRYSTNIYITVNDYFYPPKVDELKLIEYKTEINDSVEDIAEKFGVSSYTIKSSNSIYKKRTFRNNTSLIIPNKDVTLQQTKYSWNLNLERIAKKYHVPIRSLKVFYEEYITQGKNKVKVFVLKKEMKSTERLRAGYVAVPQLSEKKFIWPLDMEDVPPYIRSRYGWRLNPFNWRHWEMHLGIDIACERNAILATKSGRVIYSGVKKGYGRVVVLEHTHGFKTVYAHLSRSKVERGQYVTQNQEIAISGNTGRSTGPHLHFEIRKNNKFENPFHYLKHIEEPPRDEKKIDELPSEYNEDFE